MKREKFLWPLTQGHHGALVGARNIRNRLAVLKTNEGKDLIRLSAEVTEFFKSDLVDHFRGEEEELMKVFEAHVGENDPDLLRIKNDHKTLKELSTVTTQNEIQLFADTLTAHIRFEEDIFFPRVESILADQEKALLVDRLFAYKPTDTHCPLPL